MTGVDPAAARDAMAASDKAVQSWPATFRQVAVAVWLTQRITARQAFGRDDRDLRERLAHLWLGPEAGQAWIRDRHTTAPTNLTEGQP